jgi:hypothetical protein
MKTVKAHLQEKKPDRVEAFEKGAAAFAKKVVANFKDYEFVGFMYFNHLGILTDVFSQNQVCRREHES